MLQSGEIAVTDVVTTFFQIFKKKLKYLKIKVNVEKNVKKKLPSKFFRDLEKFQN